MAISVFTNVPSLNAQRNLNTNSAAMAKALQRLSSGMRINTAADDAAGMTISNGLTAQVKGLNQAVRNAGDGLSLLGTAESAMTEQTNLLQRMRELSVQAANDTNNASNRSSLNAEVSQLKNELDRIAKTTSFNGINLLDGTFTSKEVQIGANSGSDQRLSVDLLGSRASDLGSAYKLTGTAAATGNTALSDGALTITSNGTTTNIGASTSDGVSAVGGTYSALAKANAINAKFAATNVSATASTATAQGAALNIANASALDGTNKLTINGVDVSSASDTLTGITADAAGGQKIATQINKYSAQTGVTAVADATTGKLTLSAADGRNITVTTAGVAHEATGLNASATTTTTVGTVTLKSANAFSVGGTAASTAGIGAGAFGTAAVDSTETVSTIDLTSKAGANTAIGIIDTALSNMNVRRSGVGALTNRLNSAISNLSSAVENASASNSRILDADFAQETAAMSRQQILQQAGVAILSQANQGPQLAMSLLK